MTLESELNQAAAEVAGINRQNGWYDSLRTFGEDIALLHSEVSEMLEAYRDHGLLDATKPPPQGFINSQDVFETYGPGEAPLPKPEGVGSEAADVLVRLLDTCYRYEINLGAEFKRKLEYNATRGHRHGGKRL